MGRHLALVMPVYNEQACIVSVVRAWRDVLFGLGIDFVMLVLNDGSTDDTARALEAFADDPQITVQHQANAGHGPTILKGYRQAVQDAEWVFQCDSDDEIPPDAFAQLWSRRESNDAVIGDRQARGQGVVRRLITACAHWAVRLFFGPGIRDVNVPYRLIRGNRLGPIVARIEPHTFAPNVVISAALIRSGARIANVPVPYRARRSGRSIPSGRVCKGALRSVCDLARYRKHLGPATNDATVGRSADRKDGLS